MYLPSITSQDLVVTDEVSGLLQERKTLLHKLNEIEHRLKDIQADQIAEGILKKPTPQYTPPPAPKLREQVFYHCYCGRKFDSELSLLSHKDLEEQNNSPLNHGLKGETLRGQFYQRDTTIKGNPITTKKSATRVILTMDDSDLDEIGG